MARYSKIGVQIWGDERFCRLSKPKPNAQTLWFFLLANPARTTLPGLLHAGELSLAEGLDWPLAAFRRCWNEIEAEKMASADWSKRLVWIPKMVRWDPPNGPNVAKAWGRILKQLPECQLRCQAEAYLDAFFNGMSAVMRDAFQDGMANDVRISTSHLPPSTSHLPPASPMPSPPEHHATRVDGNGSHEKPTSKHPGGIKTTADLSYWDEGKPKPLDPETASILKKATLKPMSEILKTSEQRKAELRKPKEDE